MYNKENWKADPTLFFTPLSVMNRNHTVCRHLYVVCRNRNMNVLQKYSILYQYPQTFQTSVNSNFLWSFLGPTKRIFACINILNLLFHVLILYYIIHHEAPLLPFWWFSFIVIKHLKKSNFSLILTITIHHFLPWVSMKYVYIHYPCTLLSKECHVVKKM